jgi:hypothetical protein
MKKLKFQNSKIKTVVLNDLIGKPYKKDGRGPNFYDCWGLCMEVACRAGYKLPDYDDPFNCSDRKELIELQKQSKFRRLGIPEPWSLVLFRIIDDKGDEKWHIGVILEDCKRFIHITAKCSVCITSLKHPFWSAAIEGIYEHRPD